MAEYRVTDTQLRLIADAIRTKGSTTDPLTFPSEFVSAIAAISGADTADATATAADILNGKTAYAGGKKITGTLVPTGGIDTSDATATAADILSGKSAYVNGEKLIGTFVPDGYQMMAGELRIEEPTMDLFFEDLPFVPEGAVLYHKQGQNSTYYINGEDTLLFAYGTIAETDNVCLSWRFNLGVSGKNQRGDFSMYMYEGVLILTSDAVCNGPYGYIIWGKSAETPTEEGGG